MKILNLSRVWTIIVQLYQGDRKRWFRVTGKKQRRRRKLLDLSTPVGENPVYSISIIVISIISSS